MNNRLKSLVICLWVLCGLQNAYANLDPIKAELKQSFPKEVYVNSGTYLAIYTFTNQIPFTLVSPLVIEKRNNAPSEFSYEDFCSGKHLLPNESCQVKIYLNPTSNGMKSVQLTEAYGFDRVPLPWLSATATGGSGSGLIEGSVTTPLPTPLVLNQGASWEFTYKNIGNIKATGITISVPGSSYQTTCGSSLAVGGVCTVNGTLTPTAEGTYTVTSGLSYAQGPTVYVSTTSSTQGASGALSCVPSVAFPPEILTNSTNVPVTLLCTNKSASSITFVNAQSGAATLKGGTFTYTNPGSSITLPGASAENNCNSTQTASLVPTASCQLTGYYNATSTPQTDVSIGLSVVYDITGGASGLTAQATTTTNVVSTINNSRTITIVNQCPFTVWWGMVGGAVSGASPTDCPAGSTSNNGRCLYNGFSPTAGSYELAPNGGTATTTVIQTAASVGNTLWSGVLAGQTLCTSGASCANNDCGSNGGTTECTQGFAQPATEAEFTFLLEGSGNQDNYDITQVNGFSIPMSMSTNQSASGYSCGTAGSISAQGSLKAANYQNITPPTDMYNWVSNLASCTPDNDCATPGQMCGLNFSAAQNNFVKACGDFLGFWAANEICQTNPAFASPFGDSFTCKQHLSTPFPDKTYTLTQLFKCSPPDSTQPLFNSCYLSYTTASTTLLQQCCGCTDWTGVATPSTSCPVNQIDPQWVDNVLPRITWMKKANPTGYSYPYDDMASLFKCTASPATQYTITFCPGGQTGLPSGATDGRG